MKKVISIVLTTAILCTMLSAISFAAQISFSDVPESAWYYKDVNRAVELGLIGGKGNGRYAPEDNLTYAEAVKLAAGIHKLTFSGNSDFESADVWYAPYVDYAKQNGVITRDYSWNTKITRADFLDIFSRALPDEKLEVRNKISDGDIPDVPMSYSKSAAIYKLYRAGIVAGSDSDHNCKPGTNIKLSEVAAILTRMMDEYMRVSFSINVPAYRRTYNTGYGMYDDKLFEYEYVAETSDKDFEYLYGDNSSVNTLILSLIRNYGGALYFTLHDVDGNGTEELLISDGNTVVDAYTAKDGNLIKLFKDCYYGERGRLHVLSNGAFFDVGSGSAFTGEMSVYRMNDSGDKVVCQGSVFYDTRGAERDVYKELGYAEITEEEFIKKSDSYEALSVFDNLNWTLFAGEAKNEIEETPVENFTPETFYGRVEGYWCAELDGNWEVLKFENNRMSDYTYCGHAWMFDAIIKNVETLSDGTLKVNVSYYPSNYDEEFGEPEMNEAEYKLILSDGTMTRVTDTMSLTYVYVGESMDDLEAYIAARE